MEFSLVTLSCKCVSKWTCEDFVCFCVVVSGHVRTLYYVIKCHARTSLIYRVRPTLCLCVFVCVSFLPLVFSLISGTVFCAVVRPCPDLFCVTFPILTCTISVELFIRSRPLASTLSTRQGFSTLGRRVCWSLQVGGSTFVFNVRMRVCLYSYEKVPIKSSYNVFL